MKTLIQLSSTLLVLLLSSNLSAQVFWEGKGDGTSWNDGANWSTGMVPGANDIAEIDTSVVITGEVPVAPMRIKTGAGATVKFHLDMNLDNEASEDHALVVGAKCTVELGAEGTPYTFNFNTAANKNGILNNNSGDSSTIVVMKDATLNFNQHTNAFNLLARNTTFENNGTINISSQSKNGIKSAGLFINNGVISITETVTDGIQVIGGTFTNGEEGSITVTRSGDDCIEIIDEGTLMNNGVINTVAVDDASSNKNALAVGSADTLGYFVNGFTGELNVDGGTGDAARALYVYEEGDFTNTGMVTASGGNPATVIYNRNILLNDKDGYINLTDGRINANIGPLVNNGFIETIRDGSGIFSTENATVTNNGFFRYENSGQFASGDGMITDNGLSLNNIYRFKIDAGGSCTVDIAEVGYDWTINNNDYASSADDGTFTFLPNSIAADSVVLKTSLPEVNIKVTNICTEAVMITSVEDELSEQVKVYPSVAQVGSRINIQSTNDNSIYKVEMISLLGQQVRSTIGNSQTVSISTLGLTAGQYILRLTNEDGVAILSQITLF